MSLLRALLTAAFTMASTPVLISPAHADGADHGASWLVSVGDSYISGEAGRWAGSSNSSSDQADALGRTAYFDDADQTAEQIPGCHRSRSAEIFIDAGVNAANLACSGAGTSTDASGGHFKPGLDFYVDDSGRVGQATALRDFARSHRVRMVTVSIGGNDFNFGDVVQRCVLAFLNSSSSDESCQNEEPVTVNFTRANTESVTDRIVAGFQNIRTAMRDAGYSDDSWTLLVQNYPSPTPDSRDFRYAESGDTRQTTGGCGFWDADADWVNGTALSGINRAVSQAVARADVTNVKTLDLSSAYNGRRLCEKGVGLYEEVGLTSWTQPTAVDQTEWVSHIRTVTPGGSPYFIQESLHPNYWGQLANRSCVRQAYNDGAPRSGTCVRSGTGLTSLGEPQMLLR